MSSSYELEVQAAGEVFRYLAASDPVRERICAWLDANGLDPDDVRMPQRAVIAGGKLTIQLYERNDHGQRFMRGDDVAKVTVAVPLVEEPPECWFDRREVAA